MVIALPSLITQLNEARGRYLDLVSQVYDGNVSNSNNHSQKICLLTLEYFVNNPNVEKVMDTNVADYGSRFGGGLGVPLLAQYNYLDRLCVNDSKPSCIVNQFGWQDPGRINWYVGSGIFRDYVDTKTSVNGNNGKKSFYPVMFVNEY